MAALRKFQVVNVINLFLKVPDKTHSTNLDFLVKRCISSTVIRNQQPSECDEAKNTDKPVSKKAQEISKAMLAYLEKYRARKEFLDAEVAEFEIGKRHLANIMGHDPEAITQEEIDSAIEYLLPSGLHDKKKGRPFLKHPQHYLPETKEAQFGADGRPHHPYFYTGFPNYYKLMHDISQKINVLKMEEDKLAAKGDFEKNQIFLPGSDWNSKKFLENHLQEKLTDHQYGSFIYILKRLCDQPLSNIEKDFVFKYRHSLQPHLAHEGQKELIEAESGRKYQEASGGRKCSRAHVKIWENGTGVFTVNGIGLLDYFSRLIDREQVMFPLQLTKNLNTVDVEATVEGGGSSGQAGAIRYATSLALQSFVTLEMAEQMRLAGLLTRDPRRKERKKPGQAKARKKFTWKKR